MLPRLSSDRFTAEAGYRVMVQVPAPEAAALRAAILAEDPLSWGDYDQVSHETGGVQRFRSLPGGVNAATEAAVEVPCLELSFFLPEGAARLERVIRAIYRAHPYEEPVIQVVAALRTCHIRGLDQDNPNRFWNRADADWVPRAHRRGVPGTPQPGTEDKREA